MTSLRKSHRIARQAEATHQLIVFQMQQDWFALPIQAAQKVIPMGPTYGDPERTGVSLTRYQERELAVVDVTQRIFGQSSQQQPGPSPTYLLLVQNSQGEIVGLPIVDQPSLRRVAKTAFAPLPTTYLSQGNIQCVSSVVVQLEQEPLMFLLDPEVLVRPGLLPSPVTLPVGQSAQSGLGGKG
ncbi:hypothetical protein BST81_12225 [Leptolyngbya sp. 'hensonii']|uniref:chemotaxis protein CheW n=1 Tax=Leptolyngbya sp. 'hensonii' TaxID=1922337 RepID=UPI00094FC182|nr:chemotaxis protein CheW [Leptolyngbya sp. 'hensonii']OLP17826.1 hypothetical protein BST81_12225 [Leptolyngbya sp. 'hensonii']